MQRTDHESALTATQSKNEDRRFYVYAHCYASGPLEGAAFYIGKGTRRRGWELKRANNKGHNKARKTFGAVCRVLLDGLTNEQACSEEVELIAQLRHFGLVNIAEGGEGNNTGPVSLETRAKLSAAGIGRKLKPEAISKVVAFHTGRKRPPGSVARMSAAQKKHFESPEAVEKNRKGQLKRFQDPEQRAWISALNVGRKASPETRAKMSSSKRGKPVSGNSLAALRAAKHPPESIARRVSTRAARWTLDSSKAQSERSTSQWADPEKRRLVAEKQASNWADPAKKAARVAKCNATRAANKAAKALK